MRILRLDSWSGGTGGGQEYVRSVADELTARGHPQLLLNIVTQRPTSPAADERYFEIPRGGPRRLARDLGADEGFRRFFRSHVESFLPDLVHVHHFDALFSPLAEELSRLAVPLVFTAHDAELVCPISTLLQPGNVVCDGGVRVRCLFTGCRVGFGGPYNLWQTRVFDQRVAPKVRVFLCPSRLLAQYLHQNGYRPAVHLPPFARIPDEVLREPYPVPDSGTAPTVGYLGRLEPYKGVQDLLAAVASLRSHLPEVRLDVAGDGPYRSALEQEAVRLGISDRVTWRGHLTGAQKEEWFRSIHVLAVPSRTWENFGLVALEALTRGRPVVATNFGGLPDVVQDRESGRLVPVADPAALSGALQDVLSDPERARVWAWEGRRRSLERFTPALHVKRLLAAYEAARDGRAFSSGSAADDLLGTA